MTMIAGDEIDLSVLPNSVIATLMRLYRTYAFSCFLDGITPSEDKRREANAVAEEIGARMGEAPTNEGDGDDKAGGIHMGR